MDEGFITYRGTVAAWQCDHMGHMNVMWYVGKFDEASWQMLGSLGLTASRFRSEGLGMAAVAQEITYKRELHAGDAVTIRTSVLEVRERTIRVIHEMTDDETGDVAATTVIVAVHIDAITRRALPFPSDFRELAELRARQQ
jgi:acyl-CoA thioester hydrolase